MRYKNYHIAILLTLSLLVSSVCNAQLSLPDVISSHMVLQRNEPVLIWGKTNPNSTVQLIFQNQKLKTESDKEGHWQIRLSPMPYSATPSTMTITSDDTKIVLHDILIGEVWLCAGQSNMQWEVQQSTGGQAAIDQANNKNIRLFNVSRDVAFGEKDPPLATWQFSNPKSVATFSGVGYFFALEIYESLGIPVGMINASYGGSQAEAWTPRRYLSDDPDLRPCIDREQIWAAERNEVQARYDQDIKEWKSAVKVYENTDTTPPRKPRVPDALRPYRIAGSIYQGMIEPLIPYRVKGIMWYQGESNEERAEQYELLLSTMIDAWRDLWMDESLPFGIVQLPNFRDVSSVPTDEAWTHLRESQRQVTLSKANVELINTIDLGEAHDIHPTDKKSVADRLHLWALDKVYDRQILSTGPTVKKIKFKKKKVVVIFDEVGKGLKTKDGAPPAEFVIATEPNDWQWADAKIVGKKKVILRYPDISHPRAVRYAFNNNPANPNLTNDTGIPAISFRSDDWPGPTSGKR